ncbi:MAG: hypothetical protein IKN03_08835, partial [Fibrobacter sp.]|nr:hypothetical protein [Fibrobacter sp.]
AIIYFIIKYSPISVIVNQPLAGIYRRETRDERRVTSDERRVTSDERRVTRDERRVTSDE